MAFGLPVSVPASRLDEAMLRGVGQPVLLIEGKSDPFGTMTAARLLERTLPHARLVEMDGGHLPWLDNASACASELVGFLAGS